MYTIETLQNSIEPFFGHWLGHPFVLILKIPFVIFLNTYDVFSRLKIIILVSTLLFV